MALDSAIVDAFGEVGYLEGVPIFIHNTHLLCLEVVNEEVVEFLGHLEDAAEHVHLAAERHSRVPAPRHVREGLPYLGPGFSRHVELPQVAQLVVLVVLATEHEDAVSIGYCCVCVSLSWEHLGLLLCGS